jgi:transcriptional regulator with XRE-family HTH domain
VLVQTRESSKGAVTAREVITSRYALRNVLNAMLGLMRNFRARPADTGRGRSRYLATAFGRELRIARVTAGLSQARLASMAGTSQTEVSKAERGLLDVSLEARCRLAAACGHELGWRLYPVATVRLRDSGQMALAQVIVGAAHPSWRPRLEVPVAPGDPRAADLLLRGATEIIHIEIERALVDFQAQLRSAQVKRQLMAAQDDRPIRLVIAVPDSATSRSRLAPFSDLIAETMPATSRAIWRALRNGEPVGGDGILFIRAARPQLPTKRLPREALTP